MQKIQIMGILNVTPDSFSDGGKYLTSAKAVKRAKQLLSEGADIIDIGGESTRPGANFVSVQEEIKRVIPVIQAIKKQFPATILSIDTWKSEVAEKALLAGCTIVNSLGGFLFDEKLAEIIAKHKTKILIYHTQDKPKTMQQNLTQEDIVEKIAYFFEQQIRLSERYGIRRDQFILDPGIGFGKTITQNIQIIKRLHELQTFNIPIALGVSRKSHIGAILKENLGIETTPTERLEGSLAETTIAVQQGADIIRTHDVRETKKFLTVLSVLCNT